MIVFFLPNSRALFPTFRTNCPDGSYFAQMGCDFAQNTTTSPCSLLSSHKPLSEICTNTKHPQPDPKTPLFLSWFWKWTKWTTVWAKRTPSGQNIWKVGKTFLEVGKIFLFILNINLTDINLLQFLTGNTCIEMANTKPNVTATVTLILSATIGLLWAAGPSGLPGHFNSLIRPWLFWKPHPQVLLCKWQQVGPCQLLRTTNFRNSTQRHCPSYFTFAVSQDKFENFNAFIKLFSAAVTQTVLACQATA